MFCSNCGSPIEKDHRFCTVCGHARPAGHPEQAAVVATVDLTSVIQDIRQFRACSAIPVVLGVTLVLTSPLSLFAGVRDWNTFSLMLCSGMALGIQGKFVARGSVWAVVTLTITTCFAAFSALWDLTKDGTIQDEAGTALGIIALYVFLCWFTVKGLRATLRHHKFCRATVKWHGKSKKLPIPRDRRLLEAAKPFVTSFLVYSGGVPVAVFAGALLPAHGLVAGLVYLPFAIVASRLYNDAQRIAALRVAEIRKLDDRDPVLFIRSFSDDSLPLERRFSIVKVLAPKTLTLEEFVVNRAWGVGPVLAIGKPGEHLSPLGAAREYIEGDAWRDRIEHLMRESQLIVSVLGSTEGLLWEYQNLVRLRLLGKLLLVFPPLGLPAANQGWQLLQRVLLPTGCLGSLPAFAKNKPLAAVFSETPVLFVSHYQNETAYHAALDVAISHLKLRLQTGD